MTKQDRSKERLDHMDGGDHVGGTHFGQQQDAKTKDSRPGGDKARPNSATPDDKS